MVVAKNAPAIVAVPVIEKAEGEAELLIKEGSFSDGVPNVTVCGYLCSLYSLSNLRETPVCYQQHKYY